MSKELNDIRDYLRLVMETKACGLRSLEEATGVSFSTISRFLRGGEPEYRTLKRLKAFYEGKPIEDTKPTVLKRFSVGGKHFVVEIRELP